MKSKPKPAPVMCHAVKRGERILGTFHNKMLADSYADRVPGSVVVEMGLGVAEKMRREQLNKETL